jgi:hypothetical protein
MRSFWAGGHLAGGRPPPQVLEAHKAAGLTPSARSYLFLLSALSLADDAVNMEAVYTELFFKAPVALRPEHCQNHPLASFSSPSTRTECLGGRGWQGGNRHPQPVPPQASGDGPLPPPAEAGLRHGECALT